MIKSFYDTEKNARQILIEHSATAYELLQESQQRDYPGAIKDFSQIVSEIEELKILTR